MPRFRYRAEYQGVVVRSVIDAATKDEARRRLEAEGYRRVRVADLRPTDALFRRIFGHKGNA